MVEAESFRRLEQGDRMMDMNLELGRIQYAIRETIEDRTLNRPNSGSYSTMRSNQKEEKHTKAKSQEL